MASTTTRLLYQVLAPETDAWITVTKFTEPRGIHWRFPWLDLTIAPGHQGTAGRVLDTVTGKVRDITKLIHRRDRVMGHLNQMGSEYAYTMISEALRASCDRYFLIVGRPDAFWEIAETTRGHIPRGYKTLGSALNALWKRHTGKSGQRQERYALIDLV